MAPLAGMLLPVQSSLPIRRRQVDDLVCQFLDGLFRFAIFSWASSTCRAMP